MELWLPYGETEVCLTVDPKNLLGILEPKNVPYAEDPTAEIERALDNPIGTDALTKIAGRGGKAAIAVDDHTRRTPSYLMVPPILNRLNEAGVDDADVTVIIAGGTHRPARKDEMEGLVGKEVVERVNVIKHDPDAEDLVYLGETGRKTKIYVNRTFAESDVKILTGDVDLHYYAGYGGGRKSLLPGLSGRTSVGHNHRMMLDPLARTGNLEGNPVHLDMTEAARMVGIDFILNVVFDSEGRIVKAFAGDLEEAFMHGVRLVDQMYKIPVTKRSEIVVVSAGGAPYDINLYQASKALDNVVNLVKRGGVVVLAAECPEGHGHDMFYQWMVECKSLRDAEKRLRRKFVLGGHKAYYLLKSLQKVNVILISTLPDYWSKRVFRLDTAMTLEEGLAKAQKITGKRSKIWVLPRGTCTLPVLTEQS